MLIVTLRRRVFSILKALAVFSNSEKFNRQGSCDSVIPCDLSKGYMSASSPRSMVTSWGSQNRQGANRSDFRD